MDEEVRIKPAGPEARLWRVFFLALGGLVLSLVIFSPLLTSQAAQVSAAQVNDPAQVPGNSYLPILFRNFIATAPPSPTATATITPTPTSTGTLLTPTTTGTTTSTATPTGTGTQATITQTPTPTATGTLVASPTLRVSATPTQANINGHITFTIDVYNTGSGPFRDSLISDSFPTYIDVETVTVSPAGHGIVTKLAHSFTVTTGDVFPGEHIVITAVVKVNTSLTRTETVSNIVTMTYDTSRSLTASVAYKVVATTLPGTGELPLDWRQRAARQSLSDSWPLIGLGAGLTLIGAWTGRRKKIGPWLAAAGILLLVGSLASGCSGLSGADPVSLDQATPSLVPGAPSQTPVPYQPASAFSTPEVYPIVTLPAYPIPTPVISVTPEAGEPQPDTSPVVRIAIPALVLDAEVAYVPYDGFTWLIAGLREEVAWLGNTSWPGLGSNTALAAHVTVAGMGDGPFRYLEDLIVGEWVMLYTEQNIYTYQVSERRVTSADDLAVTFATDQAKVTLITCVDWDDASRSYLNRLIVIGDLVRVEPVVRSSAP